MKKAVDSGALKRLADKMDEKWPDPTGKTTWQRFLERAENPPTPQQRVEEINGARVGLDENFNCRSCRNTGWAIFAKIERRFNNITRRNEEYPHSWAQPCPNCKKGRIAMGDKLPQDQESVW